MAEMPKQLAPKPKEKAKKPKGKEYKAKGGESLCWVAIKKGGFDECQPVRDVNDEEINKKLVLEKGDKVFVPEKTPKEDSGPDESENVFQRPKYPPPKVEFIFEQGNGYLQKDAAGVSALETEFPSYEASVSAKIEAAKKKSKKSSREDAKWSDCAPNSDRALKELAISNYVSDRGGDGKTAGNYPADTKYCFDQLGTDDPDHFKVQVHDVGLLDSVDEVEVTLFALKPFYYKKTKKKKDTVCLHPDRFERPKDAKRTLKVKCKRIVDTAYFRSPYLRLVTTEESRKKRAKQALLVTDYWDEGTKDYEKRYTEILHQVIEAEYKLEGCKKSPDKKCVATARAELDANYSLHMAFHILNGTGVVADKIRKTVFKWTRDILAPAHTVPVIDRVKVVDEPKNMLMIANSAASTRGFHASGKAGDDKQSKMVFKVDGHQVTYDKIKKKDSPRDTAKGIKKAIGKVDDLKKYHVVIKRHRRSDVTGLRSKKSDPYDVLVYKPDKTGDGDLDPATVTFVSCTDALKDGYGPQTMKTVTNFTLNNFVCEWQPASGPQRILRWNYDVPDCINIYIVGSPILSGTSTLDGFSPYGPYAGWVADVGPTAYVAKSGVDRAFVILHEACHPLMHNVHTNKPDNDGGTQDVELMDGAILTEDQHDATKHIADAPIKAEYHLLEETAYSTVDGTTRLPSGKRGTTPVKRFIRVASSYKIMRRFANPVLDSDVTDLPSTKKAAETEADSYAGT